jgi:hypothetical protein
MAAFEEFVHVEHSSALSFEQSAGKLCGVNPVRTRALFRWKVGNPLLIGVTAMIGLFAFPFLQPTWVMVK